MHVVCPPRVGEYEIKGTIGEGAFGVVRLAYRPDLDIYYACKIIPRARLCRPGDAARFEREIRILQQLRHPRIVQLYDLRDDERNLYVMEEYCPNGELFAHIVTQRGIEEPKAQVYFKHILEGVSFVHGNNIAHRDLKPENILIDSTGQAKICDFGLGKYVGESGLTQTPCGSPVYVAPEVLSDWEEDYDAKRADCWSLGVLLFAMVTGNYPWQSRNQNELFREIRRGEFAIPQTMSAGCADLVRKLMTLDVGARLTAAQALEHPWIKDVDAGAVEVMSRPLVSLRRLDRFFAREVSSARVRPPPRVKSTGNARISYIRQLRIITPEDRRTERCLPWIDVQMDRWSKLRRG